MARSSQRRSEPPAINLEERQQPSRRNPLGAGRCQAVVFKDGVPQQCKKNAREPFKVCGSHGAGYRKRELEGTAKNPALAPLKTGTRAKPETIQQLLVDQPHLAALYEKNLNDDELLDMRPVLAQAKALAEWVVTRIDHDGKGNQQAMAFKAIQALSHVMRTASEMLRVEERLGPVSHAEMRRMTNGIANTIRKFVPEDQQAEALSFLRQQVTGGN